MTRACPLLVMVLLVVPTVAGCAREDRPAAGSPSTGEADRPSVALADDAMRAEASATPAGEELAMRITSSAFREDGSIPSKYTCDESDASPPLTVSGVPNEAKSLALIVDDPDVPPPGSGTVWDHWLVFNIPPDTRGAGEGEPFPGVTGRNSWGRNGWGGPCPPDREHRYFFRLYALDTTLDLTARAGRRELEAAMKGHVVARATLMGRYGRKR